MQGENGERYYVVGFYRPNFAFEKKQFLDRPGGLCDALDLKYAYRFQTRKEAEKEAQLKPYRKVYCVYWQFNPVLDRRVQVVR